MPQIWLSWVGQEWLHIWNLSLVWCLNQQTIIYEMWVPNHRAIQKWGHHSYGSESEGIILTLQCQKQWAKWFGWWWGTNNRNWWKETHFMKIVKYKFLLTGTTAINLASKLFNSHWHLSLSSREERKKERNAL